MSPARVRSIVGGAVVVALVVAVVLLVMDDRHQRNHVDRLQRDISAARQAAATGARDLDALKRQLDAAQKELDATKGTADAQASQIDVLKSCLAGVSNFFDKASAGDQRGAVAALNAVQGQCDAADKLLPQ
jgi:septal ring factor EnvC (AmiA/AmiB activator)